MKRTVDFMNTNLDIPGKRVAVEDVYRDGFLPEEPIRP